MKKLCLSTVLVLAGMVLLMSPVFCMEHKIVAGDPEPCNKFGHSVSISGDYAVVASNTHSAYIFHNDGVVWSEIKKLTVSDNVDAVSISGDYAIVGVSDDDYYGTNSGAAYVYYRNMGGTDNWGEQRKLLASDGEEYDILGSSVSITGNYAVVGARGDDSLGYDSGAVYVFHRNEGGTDNWGEQQKLIASDGEGFDLFGQQVAISGDWVIIGTKDDNEYGMYTGSAYIFHFDSSTWSEHRKLLASDAETQDQFGDSVAISGDYAIVGASRNGENYVNPGAAYVYYRNMGGTDNWGEQMKLIAGDGEGGDHFGHAVTIDGDYAVVGAYLDDDNGPQSGSAYIFNRNEGGPDNWGEQQKLLASDGGFTDMFGNSVSRYGDCTIVGAPEDNVQPGAAYIYDSQLLTPATGPIGLLCLLLILGWVLRFRKDPL